jgi:hypothetical protein
MGFLTAQQTASIKRVRKRAWNQAFMLETYQIAQVENLYDSLVTGPPTQRIFSGDGTGGDWLWTDQLEKRGRPGGWVEGAEILLACDIDYAPAFMQSGVRLLVPNRDGVVQTCEILKVTEYPGSGEVVVAASTIRRGG